MPTEKPFFKHDLDARTDRKMVCLAKDFKSSGVGIFWVLLEILYQEGGEVDYNDLTFIMVAQALFEDFERVKTVVVHCVEKIGLFDAIDGKLVSNRASDALHKMKNISQIRSEIGKKGAKASHLPGKRLANAKKKGKKEADLANASQMPGKCQPSARQNLHKDKEEDKEYNTVIDRENGKPSDPVESEIQNPDGRRGVEHSVEHPPGKLEDFGSAVVIFDVEEEVVNNPIQFERLCKNSGIEAETARQVVHTCHLWLTKNEKYPIGRKAAYAHVETFLNNPQYHPNGSSKKSAQDTGRKGGTSVDRINKMRELSAISAANRGTRAQERN